MRRFFAGVALLGLALYGFDRGADGTNAGEVGSAPATSKSPVAAAPELADSRFLSEVVPALVFGRTAAEPPPSSGSCLA
ncbi:MAG TPA: hypothetical protein VNC50_06915, partial [Planctomycetia bacterium]|nr:hypothetical protein [Planctomycetia bacterium]